MGLGDPVNGHFFLLRTRDAGITWLEVHPKVMPEALPGEGAFDASNTSFSLSCGTAICFGTGGGAKARIFRSEDHGDHWTVVDTPIPAGKASAGIFSIELNFLDGIAVGGDYQNPHSLVRMLQSRTTVTSLGSGSRATCPTVVRSHM
jgi:photosystem II stability/assembly factor-like uncharacterized protein